MKTVMLAFLVAAATAAGVSFVLSPRPASALPPAGVSGELAAATEASSAAALAQLEQRLDELERKLLLLRTADAAAPTDAAPERQPVEATDRGAMADLQRRLAVLEQRAAQEAAVAAGADAALLAARRSQEMTPEQVEAAQQKILTAESEADKLDAWRSLRRVEGEWNAAVVQEMARIGLNSSDAATRADVWRQADGRTRQPLLVPALLRALYQDPVVAVREEAAETLVAYVDDPRVRAAFESVLQSETDQGIRDYAQGALRR